MSRYLSLLALQLRTSLLLAMQYRVDFLLDVLIEIAWASTSLVPLLVVFGAKASIAGWTYAEALLVVGWFTLLMGVIRGRSTQVSQRSSSMSAREHSTSCS